MNKIFRFPFLWTFEISGVDLHSPCACQLFLVCSGMQDSVLSPNLQAPQWPQRSASKWEKKKEKPKRKREKKYPKLQCMQPAENRAEYTQLPFVQWLLRLSRSCACLVRKRGMTEVSAKPTASPMVILLALLPWECGCTCGYGILYLPHHAFSLPRWIPWAIFISQRQDLVFL